jgi:hypothetical protein
VGELFGVHVCLFFLLTLICEIYHLNCNKESLNCQFISRK